MTLFATRFRRASWPGLGRYHGETVTYHPHTYFGETTRESRSITAIVTRETDDGPWQVQVVNNGTTGITSSELDYGRDQIELERRDGEASSRRTITRPLSHDSGMLLLECQ